MATIEEIEKACKVYADANDDLTELRSEIQTQVESIKTKYYRQLKSKIDGVVKAHSDLHELVEASPGLFNKPKTATFHGVKTGFQKGKDTLEIKNVDKTIELIEKIYDEDRAAELLNIEKVPAKDVIKDLPEAELKEIKCKIIPGKNDVLIKTVDTEVDKMIKTLTKQALEIE